MKRKNNTKKEFFAALISIILIVGIVILVLKMSLPNQTDTLKNSLAGNAFLQQVPPAETSKASDVSLACSDSDPSNDPHTFGYVQAGETKVYDGCDGAKAIEHYCEEGVIKSKMVSCSQRCAHGICDPKAN